MTAAVTLAALGNGPAFSAYGSANQTLANSTAVKIQFNTEEFDTNSCFDSTTNYRFTPTVAGYYLFNSTIFFPVSATGISVIYLYKNGSSVKLGVLNNSANGNSFPSLSALVYANGTTDYFEIYGLQTSGASQSAGSSEATRPFSAVLVRSAV